jgi:hypothetical protein
MVATVVDKQRVDKRATERAAQIWIEKKGGTFLHTNWNKHTIHYVSPTGKKCVIRIGASK